MYSLSLTSKKLFNKLIGLVFRLQITFYTFLAHVVTIFYVPWTHGNRLVVIRTSTDTLVGFYCRRKWFCLFCQNDTSIGLRIFSNILSFTSKTREVSHFKTAQRSNKWSKQCEKIFPRCPRHSSIQRTLNQVHTAHQSEDMRGKTQKSKKWNRILRVCCIGLQ